MADYQLSGKDAKKKYVNVVPGMYATPIKSFYTTKSCGCAGEMIDNMNKKMRIEKTTRDSTPPVDFLGVLLEGYWWDVRDVVISYSLTESHSLTEERLIKEIKKKENKKFQFDISELF